MKVIANVDYGHYICEVSHEEIEKFMDLFYGNLKRLKTGDVVDLTLGYNFNKKAQTASQDTKECFKSNQKIIDFIKMYDLNGE